MIRLEALNELTFYQFEFFELILLLKIYKEFPCAAAKFGLGVPAREISERGSAPEGVGTPRYLSILSGNSACQVPICAVAA